MNQLFNTIPTVATALITGIISGGNIPTVIGAGTATAIGTVAIVVNDKRRLDQLTANNQLRTQELEGTNRQITEQQAAQHQLQVQELEGSIRQITEQQTKLDNIQTLNAQLLQLQQEQKHLQEEKQALEQSVNNLHISIGDRTGALASVSAEYEENRNRLDILVQQKTDLDDAIARLKDSNPNLDRQGKLVHEIERLQLQSNQLQGRKEALSLEVIKLQEEQKNLSQVTGELTVKTEQLKQLQENVQHLNPVSTQVEQLKLESSQLQGRKEALSTEVTRLQEKQEQLKEVTAELTVKTEQLNKVEENLTQSTLNTRKLEQKEHTLHNQIRELETVRVSYDKMQTEQEKIQTNIEQLRPQVQSLQAQKDEILNAIRNHQGDYQRIIQCRQELAQIERTIKEKQNQLEILCVKEESINTTIQELEEEKGRIERDKNRIITELNEERERIIAKLKQERDELERQLASLRGQIEIEGDTARKALESLRNPPLWTNISRQPRLVGDEMQFITTFQNFLQQKGLFFPERIIKAFHTSFKVQDISALAILAGISGTGKSELPRRYADYIGAQMLDLAVQPRWDSPQDLLGFYNYIEKKYKPTELMRGIYQYHHLPELNDRIVIVLLDEMNLARIEYYFSEFLSKLEIRRSRDAYLDLDVGSLPLTDKERRVLIPKQFLFVGTMNEDETTQSLSDKVLDRSNVLTFGKPNKLKLMQEKNNTKQVVNDDSYVSYSEFKKLFKEPDPLSNLVKEVKDKVDTANNIMGSIKNPFGHRVYQAIVAYVVNYPGVGNDQDALNAALADQFAQKLLPKLRGVLLDEYPKELDQLKKLIDSIGDKSLTNAFEIALKGSFGQFQWRGMTYEEEGN